MWRLTYVLPALFMSLLFILRAPPRKVAKGLVGLKVLRKFTSFFLVRQKKIIMKLKGGPWVVHDFETLVDFTDLLLMKWKESILRIHHTLILLLHNFCILMLLKWFRRSNTSNSGWKQMIFTVVEISNRFISLIFHFFGMIKIFFKILLSDFT